MKVINVTAIYIQA